MRHFLAGQNGVRGKATLAAVAAGYSTKTTRHSGKRALSKASIQAAIAAYYRRHDITADRGLEEIARSRLTPIRHIAESTVSASEPHAHGSGPAVTSCRQQEIAHEEVCAA